MNRRLILSLMGKVLLLEGGAMLPALCISLIYRAGDHWPLLISAAITALIGFLLSRVHLKNSTLRAREGFVTVALCWVALSVFGALPFVIGGGLPFADALFESASGFTTTGSTILRDVEAFPKGLMFWRCFTQWIGGMGILVLSMALIPKMGASALHLLRAESTGITPGKLVPRIGNATRLLYLMYVALSLMLFVLYMVFGMDPYDAMVHTFATAGTGGYSSYNLSIGYFNSAAIEMVTATFLILFGVNFTMYFVLITKNYRDVLKNEELRTYLLIVLLSVAFVAASILPSVGSVVESLRQSYFTVASVMTTAGYATADFNLWPTFARGVLVLLMIIGGCAGSTGGGLKVIRSGMLFKGVLREVRRNIHPRGVSVVKWNGKAVEEDVLSQTNVFFFAYVLLIIVFTLILSLGPHDLETALTAAITAIGNVGPGLGEAGPTGNFAAFSPFHKILLSLLMITGRLEIYPMLMLLSRAAWRKGS